MGGRVGDLEAGELGLLVDSNGRMAIVLCRASAADQLAPLTVGDTVWISADRSSPAVGAPAIGVRQIRRPCPAPCPAGHSA